MRTPLSGSNVSELFPIDFNALQKGDVISQVRIETIYRVKAADDPNRYRTMMLRLVDEIEKERHDLYPRTRGNTVVIQTDEEARDHNANEQRRMVRSLGRNWRRRVRIDRKNFTDAEKRTEEARDMGYAAVALAARKALRRAERDAQLLAAGPETEEADPEE